MKRLILVAALLALSSPGRAYAPVENLEHVDVALIDTAKNEIDLAAYVLTGWPVMQALTRAADRNVKVRIYLDGTQLAKRDQSKVFHLLTRRASKSAQSASPAPSCTSRATRMTAGCWRRELFSLGAQAPGQ